MSKRKRDADEEEADISGSLSAKAVKHNPAPAPVQTSPVSEEDDSDTLKAVGRRPVGRLNSRIHHVRAPRGKKKCGTVGVAVAAEDVSEEDEEESGVDEEHDDGDEEGKDPAHDDESVDGNEEEGDGEDDEKEEQNDEDGEEERNNELIMPAHLGEPKDEDGTDEVTEEALEHRLGIGQQTKSAPPNQPPLSWPLSREREAALVALHVQPFANPNAVGFATSTGARKHTVPKVVSLDTAYTPNLEDVFDNTGARKGAWSTGVDPDTEYAGDVMLFPTVDCVSKGIDLLRVLVLNCDQEETAPHTKPLVEADDQPAASIEDKVVGLHPALPSGICGTPARTSSARRKVVCLAFNSLKTSEEPTFTRGMKLPLTKHGKFGTIVSRQDENATLPLINDSSSSESTAPTAPSNISLTLQAIMQGSGIPRGLHELELIVKGLADGMGLAPEPSYLDMRGGRKFDLDKEMARYSLPSHGRRLEPVDYTGRLLSLLNIQGC